MCPAWLQFKRRRATPRASERAASLHRGNCSGRHAALDFGLAAPEHLAPRDGRKVFVGFRSNLELTKSPRLAYHDGRRPDERGDATAAPRLPAPSATFSGRALPKGHSRDGALVVEELLHASGRGGGGPVEAAGAAEAALGGGQLVGGRGGAGRRWSKSLASSQPASERAVRLVRASSSCCRCSTWRGDQASSGELRRDQAR